jgi:hypothetical protein
MEEARIPTRRVLASALLVVCSAVVAGPPGVAEVAEAEAPSPARLKKAAERKTIEAVRKRLPRGRGHGLEDSRAPLRVKVTSCKRRGGPWFRCSWNVHGELAGRVPLRCNGTARVAAAGRRPPKGVACRNIAELQAPLLASPHDVLFGYFEDFTTVTDLWDELDASGANVFREGITWKSLQPSESSGPLTWNWSGSDAVYAAALALGLRPVFVFRNAPCWAAPSPCRPNAPNPVAPGAVGDYAYAAAQIAIRYPEALAIEIWLEPNSAKFWGAPADPAAFSALVKAAADAIHATGTGVEVYSGGLAPGMANPEKIVYGRFLSRALEAGGIKSADAVGFHAVTNVPFRPGDDPTRGYLGRLRIQVQSLQTALSEHRVSKPIVLTQLSYSTGAGYYSEAEQAEALVSSYEVARRLAGVPLVMISRLLDNGDGSKVAGFGVLRSDRAPKPAYCALAVARGVVGTPGC